MCSGCSLDERLSERDARAVGGRDRLVTARANGGEHAVDERRVVPGMDAERVALVDVAG